jgi:hypothetical protein
MKTTIFCGAFYGFNGKTIGTLQLVIEFLVISETISILKIKNKIKQTTPNSIIWNNKINIIFFYL